MDYQMLSLKLEGEYQRVFEEVEAYTIVKNYAGEGNDEQMMDLLDLLLTAQEEGKAPEKIIGSDVKKFCEEYFSAYDRKADRTERFIKGTMWYAGLGVFNCLLDLFDENMKFVGYTPGLKTDWTVMLCSMGVAFLVSMLLDGVFRMMYRRKPMRSGKMYAIILFMAVVSFVLGLITAKRCGAIILLPFLPTIIVCIVDFVLSFIYIRIKNYQKYGSVWKPKEKEEKQKIMYVEDVLDEVSTPYEKELFRSFSELYNKKNAKRKKRNQPALTPEEFMEFLEQENEKLRRDSRRVPVLWGIICVITTAVMAVIGGFSDILDGCIFFAVLAGLMAVIYYFVFAKFIYGKILSDRVRLLAKCRKNNKTVLDYAERESKME